MASNEDTKVPKHIMISYQWNSQKRMMKLRDKLRGKGYNVWMDVDKMGGNTLSCMGKAVENAEVVLICISEEYQQSSNCQAEAEYAFTLKKQIIPLKYDSEFKPSDWLGPLMGARLYYLVHTDEKLEEVFPNLIRDLGDKGRTAAKVKWAPVNKEESKALQCSICLERFKTPKTLPCLHSFCKECLIRVAPLGKKTISCPLCREKFPVPCGGVTKFPTNFHLKELVEEDALRQQQLAGAGVEFSCTCCEVGKQSRVVAKCQDCKLYICNIGLAAHERFDALREHHLLVFEKEASAETIAEMDPTREHKTNDNDWKLFSEMYDEEHSIHLFKYWMQQHGGDSDWQSSMVNHYLSCLSNLEESGKVSHDLLARRQQEVARVFKQAGQYDNALELTEKTIDMERKELGERKESMADLYYLAADIYREIINSITLIEARDPRLVQKQIQYARNSLKLRETLAGDDNKFELGKVLRLLSVALVIWIECGGDSELSVAEAEIEARKCIDKAIEIFTQLNAKGNTAKTLANKAIFEERGSEEQEKLFRKALELCEEAYGECCVLSGRLYWNMFVLYEERDDQQETYKWLDKCREIRENVYGQRHPQTQQVYEKLKTCTPR